MDFEYSVLSQPPVDDTPDSIPLPCYGRGLPLTPLPELPLFKFLKKQYEESLVQPGHTNEVRFGIGRGKILTLSSGLPADDVDAGCGDVVGSYWHNQIPLRVSSLDAGLEPLSSDATGVNETACRPPGSAPRSALGRGRGTRTSGKNPTSKGPGAAISGSVIRSSMLPLLPPSQVMTASSQVSQSAQDAGNATEQPGTFCPSSVPSRRRGIADSWKLRIQQLLKQQGRVQPFSSGAWPSCPQTMSGPPPPSSHQAETARSSQQPPLSKPRKEPSFPPRKAVPRGAPAAVPFDPDSIYESCISSSGSSSDLLYESAVEVTPSNAPPESGGAMPVPSAVLPAPDSPTVVRDSIKLVPEASIPNSTAVAALTEKQKMTPLKETKVLIRADPDAPDSVPEKPKKTSSKETEVLIQAFPKADRGALIAPSSTAAENDASASVPKNQEVTSGRGTRVWIKGLPKGITPELIYYNTASFASIDDLIITADEHGASAEIVLSKPYSAMKLCQCLQEALTLEGCVNQLEFSCLNPT